MVKTPTGTAGSRAQRSQQPQRAQRSQQPQRAQQAQQRAQQAEQARRAQRATRAQRAREGESDCRTKRRDLRRTKRQDLDRTERPPDRQDVATGEGRFFGKPRVRIFPRDCVPFVLVSFVHCPCPFELTGLRWGWGSFSVGLGLVKMGLGFQGGFRV